MLDIRPAVRVAAPGQRSDATEVPPKATTTTL